MSELPFHALSVSQTEAMSADHTPVPAEEAKDLEYMVKPAVYEPYFVTDYNHNQRPPVIPEVVTTDVDKAIQDCVMSNKWAMVGAYENPKERRPLHAIRILEEDEDEEPTRVAWGGREYASEGEYSGPNMQMVGELVQVAHSSLANATRLPPIKMLGENDSSTTIEIIRYPLKNGWSIDVAVVSRQPRPVEIQAIHYEHRAEIYAGKIAIEHPETHVNIWGCPPGKGLDKLYFRPSDKGKAGDVVTETEKDIPLPTAPAPRVV